MIPPGRSPWKFILDFLISFPLNALRKARAVTAEATLRPAVTLARPEHDQIDLDDGAVHRD